MTIENYTQRGKAVAKKLLFSGFGSWVLAIASNFFNFLPVVAYVIFLGLGLFLMLLSLFAYIGTGIANQAANKGRSWQAFFWLSVLVNPVVMWIIAASISPLPGSPLYRGTISEPRLEVNSSEQLVKLAELLKAGVITQEEFDAKKQELLARI